MKLFNFITIILGIISCLVFWYFTLFTNSLNGSTTFDYIYLHLGFFIASHGFTIGSIKWFNDNY